MPLKCFVHLDGLSEDGKAKFRGIAESLPEPLLDNRAEPTIWNTFNSIWYEYVLFHIAGNSLKATIIPPHRLIEIAHAIEKASDKRIFKLMGGKASQFTVSHYRNLAKCLRWHALNGGYLVTV